MLSVRGHLSPYRAIQPQVGKKISRFNHRAIVKFPPAPYTEPIPVIRKPRLQHGARKDLYHDGLDDRFAARDAPPGQQRDRAGRFAPRARPGAPGQRISAAWCVPLNRLLYYYNAVQEDRQLEELTMGTRISARRREKGLTQEALANMLGVSNQAVSKWESEGSLR